MSEEKIITSATITSGENHDVKVETFIGDAKYSEKDKIVYTNFYDINKCKCCPSQ